MRAVHVSRGLLTLIFKNRGNGMQARVDLDAWYVEHTSLTLDLLILARTPFEVLRSRNAV